MNLPTKITIARMCLIPIMVIFFYVQFVGHFLVAGIIYIISASTDFVDGYLARSRGLVTNLGKLLDPLADKVLVVVALFLIVELRVMYMLGPLLCGIIMAREIIIGGIRQIAASNNMVLQADKWGKVKTIFTNIALPTLIISQFFVEMGAVADITLKTFSGLDSLSRAYWIVKFIGNVLLIISFVFTILSAANYILKNWALLSKIDKTDLPPNEQPKDSEEQNIEMKEE